MPFNKIDPTGFIGQGIAWPIVLQKGQAILCTGFELLNSSLLNIVAWPLGTRIMMGEYGSRIDELIEEQNTVALQALLRTFFNDAISEWETRVNFVDLEVTYPSTTEAIVRYYYNVGDSQPTQSFVIPLYRNIIS